MMLHIRLLPYLVTLYKCNIIFSTQFKITTWHTCHFLRIINFFSLSVHNLTQLIFSSCCVSHVWCRHSLAVSLFLWQQKRWKNQIYANWRSRLTYTHTYWGICPNASSQIKFYTHTNHTEHYVRITSFTNTEWKNRQLLLFNVF